MDNPVIDILKYFAKFPDRDAVLKNFSRSTEKVPGYDALKTYITGLPDPLMPEINGFIYTSDADKLSEYIRNQKGYYMLIEFGAFAGSDPNNFKSRDIEWLFAITIAHHDNTRNTDSIEEALLADQALVHCINLLEYMKQDDSDLFCANQRFLNTEIDISPIEPMLLLQSYGWVITFKKKVNNLF
jgi:hypothetical protein